MKEIPQCHFMHSPVTEEEVRVSTELGTRTKLHTVEQPS
jgi:hypothetical protein